MDPRGRRDWFGLRASEWTGLGVGRVVLLLAGTLLATAEVRAHPPAAVAPAVDPEAEALIHRPPGFTAAGNPAVCTAANGAQLKVTVVDRATGLPAYCRVNVVGPDGQFYEPKENVLAPWSLQRAGNRLGKGPFRYYGWFFYSTGQFEVRVPPGATRVEVWKGFEYRPTVSKVDLAEGATHHLKVELERTAPIAELGYYSGDTHIHLPRQNETDDARALDLMAAEDIQYGTLLCYNKDSRTYTGKMSMQGMPQQQGFGRNAVAERKPYMIASGQEYVTSTYGHICLLLHDRLVLDGQTSEPNNWPLLGLLGEETRKLGGYSIHAHGGYGLEIYADSVQRSTDGVELLQFAEYRGIALEGWYRMLNVGFRFPAVGACDFPYCRVLGDCRTYVYSPTRPTFVEWVQRAAQGRSFFTTGPLLLLEVEGGRPGDVVALEGNKAKPVTARIRVRSEVAPVSTVELIVNGRSVVRRAVPDSARSGWFEFEHAFTPDGSTWVAARAQSDAPAGRPDVEAHTNPVYLIRDGKLPYSQPDVDWLVGKLDERVKAIDARKFPMKQAVLDYYAKSRGFLLEIRESGGRRVEALPAP